MCAHECVHVSVSVCVCIYVLRIVSMDKILCFIKIKNIFLFYYVHLMPWLLTLCAEAEAASQAVAQVQGCVLLTYDHGLTAWTVDDILHFIKGPLKKIAACAIDIILFSMEIVHSIQKYLKIPQQAAQTCFLYFSGKYHSKQHR